MILVQLVKFCIGMVVLAGSVLHAADIVPGPVGQTGFIPAASTHANWIFSGIASDESGERYAYFFQMQRHENNFHVMAALFDAQTKAMILKDEADAVISDPERNNWRAGHSFLRFNAINNSWVFGVKDMDKKGFNFKVDMLNQPEHNPVAQGLRAGVDVIVSQTGQLNGLVQTGSDHPDLFVTAKNAWFRQVWLSNDQNQIHPISSVLCRFNDGSGFYSMHMPEPDAVRGSVAGWFDSQGAPAAMSQFINVKEATDGFWHIHVTSPSLNLTVSDEIKQSSMVAGFVAGKDNQGFCVLNEEAMGQKQVA